MAHKWTTNKTVSRRASCAWITGTLVPYMRVTIYCRLGHSAAELIAEILIIHPPSDIGRG